MSVLVLQYLLHDPIDLAVLGVNLLAHVKGHVTQIANDPAHLLQVLIHLILPGIICYPGAHRKRKKDYLLARDYWGSYSSIVYNSLTQQDIHIHIQGYNKVHWLLVKT